jgi:LPS-assembly protein
MNEDQKQLHKEEKREQSVSLKVEQLLSKARDLRFEGNFASARKHAEKALKIDPDSREAKAFIDHLADEEKLYARYQAVIKAESLKRKEFEKQRRIQNKLDKKTRSLIEKSHKYFDNRQLGKAEIYARKALNIDANNTTAKEILAEINRLESPVREKSVEKKERAADMPPEQKPSVPGASKARTPTGKDTELLKLSPGQPIIVDGDKVEYFEKEGRIEAEGNVSITYGDAVLQCDRIEVNTVTREALCEGNVRVNKTEGVLTSDKIRYDYDKKEGEIIGAIVKAYPFFGAADETVKAEGDHYILRNGYITTCDHDEPHYHLSAKEINVFPGEKIIARNVVAYIGKVPVLWIPYYYQPVMDVKAKVQFIPGVTSEWGYFLLSAWRAYVHGDSRADILLDYRSKKGFAEGLNFYYNAKDFNAQGLGYGLFRMYFIEQNGWGTYEPTSYRDNDSSYKQRKRIQWKHRIDFDPNTVGIIEFNKLSDQWVLKDYFYNEYEEAERTPPNYISLISNQRNFTFSVEANKRFNDFYTVVEKMPEIKVDVPDQRLWETPFYYSTESSLTAFRKLYATEKDERYEIVNRADTFHKLSFVSGLGPLNLTPYGAFRETVYSKRDTESKIAARMVVGGGVDASVRFHRAYDFKTDFMGLHIDKVRHVFVPRAEYFHTHQPTIDRNTLFQMDDIDSIEKENGLRLALENKLQIKRRDSEGKTATVDFLRSIVSVDYLFRMRKGKFEFEENGDFRNLEMKLELRPYDWMFIDGEMGITPANEAISTASLELSINPVDYFRMNAGYRYEKMAPDSRNQITFDAEYIINPKWRVGIYERFDIQNQDFEQQQYSITRDLHCWEVELTYDLKGSNFIEDNFTCWLAFKLKAFPELPIGLNRSFDRRAPGLSQTQTIK